MGFAWRIGRWNTDRESELSQGRMCVGDAQELFVGIFPLASYEAVGGQFNGLGKLQRFKRRARFIYHNRIDNSNFDGQAKEKDFMESLHFHFVHDTLKRDSMFN